MSESKLKSHRERDAVTFLVIGSFFVILSVLVGVGSFWAEALNFAVAVNIGASVVLLLVGVAMVLASRWLRRFASSTDEDAA